MPLTLSRKIGEWVVIGDSILVRVSDVQRRGSDEPRVKLTIQAPPDVRIKRGELGDDRGDTTETDGTAA